MQVPEERILSLPSADLVIGRLQEIYGARSDAGLAKALDIPKTTISSWRQRSAVPFEKCLQIAIEKKIYADWIFFGIGPKEWATPSSRPAASDPLRLSDEGRRLMGSIVAELLQKFQARKIQPNPAMFSKLCLMCYEIIVEQPEHDKAAVMKDMDAMIK